MEKIVKIVKYTGEEDNIVGFSGILITNLQSFMAITGTYSIMDVLITDKNESCIGIVNHELNKSFLWTKRSNFDIVIEYII